MGKNSKKGGLIEDRVIRNPMDQMRRKLKFKEKEKRKETRVACRELREEFGMAMSRKDAKYRAQHDPDFINQLKTGMQEDPEEEEMDTGPTNQELSMQMWGQMEQNYSKMQAGEQVNFQKNDPFLMATQS